MYNLRPRRSRIVTMAAMELINAFTLSCSTSSLRMMTSLLTRASYQRNGGAELLPPPRRYALSKPGQLPSSVCHTMLSSTRISPGRKRCLVIGTAERKKFGCMNSIAMGGGRRFGLTVWLRSLVWLEGLAWRSSLVWCDRDCATPKKAATAEDGLAEIITSPGVRQGFVSL